MAVDTLDVVLSDWLSELMREFAEQYDFSIFGMVVRNGLVRRGIEAGDGQAPDFTHFSLRFLSRQIKNFMAEQIRRVRRWKVGVWAAVNHV